MRLALVGLGGGVALALLGTRTLRSQLYGIRGTEPATYLALSAILLVVALLATSLPARRATRVDPMGVAGGVAVSCQLSAVSR